MHLHWYVFPAVQNWAAKITNKIQHTDVCQYHLTQLVAVNDGQSISYLQAFLTYLFDVLTFFLIKKLSLLVQCNACEVDIGFGKGVGFFLHICIGVRIDLGCGTPEIDLPGSQERAPSDCLS